MKIDLLNKKGKIVFNEFSLNKNIPLQMQLDSLKEDMMQIKYPNGYILDIGWRPSFNINGHFYIYLIKDFNWEKPIYSNCTNDINTLEYQINQAINKIK
ncbi:hypothetical protein [Snodgrassella alvi]|jgi:hypothetical protein|uniref:Uncharacterized protein n=1 Tax=Snodgrassella alvi TaxID=1196083 RepID=A0A855FSJ6_9NEIS|nr:hypothetical protein [Snodgrassella alvi]PIT61225.1 hypothetical protein BHC57_02050 [Snodgrassella alvi]